MWVLCWAYSKLLHTLEIRRWSQIRLYPYGSMAGQRVSRSWDTEHASHFFLHRLMKCETDVGIILTQASCPKVDRQLLILVVLNKMNHFIFLGDSSVGCKNPHDVTFSLLSFSSEQLSVSTAIKYSSISTSPAPQSRVPAQRVEFDRSSQKEPCRRSNMDEFVEGDDGAGCSFSGCSCPCSRKKSEPITVQ